MQERFQREQEFLAKERQKEKEARAEAYRKEQERIAKAEAARQETERILEAQQKLVEARKREMATRDAEREAKKLEKQRILVRHHIFDHVIGKTREGAGWCSTHCSSCMLIKCIWPLCSASPSRISVNTMS